MQVIHIWAFDRPHRNVRAIADSSIFQRDRLWDQFVLRANGGMQGQLESTKGRRRPMQARARQKVEAILEATELALRSIPATDLAMRDVARRAGVKPATLYDYFPTKELLLRGCEDRAWARAAEHARAVVEKGSDLPLHDAIAMIVEAFMREMAATARLVGGLTPESPFGHETRTQIGAAFAAFAAEALGSRACEVREADLQLRMCIATEAVGVLTWVFARDHAGKIDDGSYCREVGRMIAHYFVRDP